MAGIRWVRIAIAAVLLELAIFAVLFPISLIFGSPFVSAPASQNPGPTVFLVSVPIACFVLGYVVSVWLVRNVRSQFVLHGTLLGLLATVLYLALCAAQPGSIPAVVAIYGLFLFCLSQALRIAGCVAGAFSASRGRAAPEHLEHR